MRYEALHPVRPGEMGRLAKSGRVPLGCYCGELATRTTFPVVTGARYAVLGKAHPAVLGALVAGIPDEKFGDRVAAVVQVRTGVAAPGRDEMREHRRTMLAGYKGPSRIEFEQRVVRSPRGKAGYLWGPRHADAVA